LTRKNRLGRFKSWEFPNNECIAMPTPASYAQNTLGMSTATIFIPLFQIIAPQT
jgi:hypothetical protein